MAHSTTASLTGNSASYSAAGHISSTLYNCTLTGNSASSGGGAHYGTLYNCTLTGNSASSGGGAYHGTLYNCTAYYNMAPQNPNYSGGTLNYCCTLPMPSSGVGNFTNAPGLAGLTNPHLTQGSPCIDAGNNAYVFTAADLDGEARTNGTTVDVGCDEFWADSRTGTLQVAILTPVGTSAATGYPLSFQADINGHPLTYVWRFGDGVLTTNGFLVSHAYESSGEYLVVLEAANLSGSVSATVTVQIVSMAGATRYVATNGNDAADGMSWATAKATIQAGINVTIPGGLVFVSNGVYATGGAFAAGVTNRIVITNALTVQSVNGPKVTMIEGQGPMGQSAVRCAYVADGAKLIGFTLTKGFTRTSYDNASSGGGIYCDSVAGIVSNCTLIGNSASSDGGGACNGTLYNCALTGNLASSSGGGAYNGTFYNCTLTGNSASHGGGASGGTLYNCTLTSNSASSYSGGGGASGGTLYNCTLVGNLAYWDGGGTDASTLYNCMLSGNSASHGGGASDGVLYNCTLTGNSASYYGGGVCGGTLYNCIVYYNHAAFGANYDYSTFYYSCTAPYPDGLGNITSEPQLASFSHLAVGSPCRGAGYSNYARGTDIDGEVWRVPPSMGCDEVVAGAITGALSVSAWAAPTNVAVGFPLRFRADIMGRTTRSAWDFGDGTVVSNNPYALHAYTSPGVYAVLLRAYNESYPQGITATVTVHVAAQAIHYVKLGNATPIAPYTSWETAATNIQDAIDAADQVGALVLVSNGIYATGGRVVYGVLSNRVAITKPMTVRSVNGPARTIIQGAGPVGDSAVRCAYVGINAMLEGFTLTNGATCSSGDWDREESGGGVWCESSGVLSNCILTGNSASYGGGTHYGTLYNCTLTGNSASYGGGAHYGTLYNCTLTGNSAVSDGGGAESCTLNNCTLIGNSAHEGGGAYSCTLHNSTLTGNSAFYSGGGAYNGMLYNCTLTWNSASSGGGVEGSTLYNCIVYYNTAPQDPNYTDESTLNYCCTLPVPSSGIGNFTNAPSLAGLTNPHLTQGSPCIDAGNNAYVFNAVDLDGEARTEGTTVDVGCDEFWADSCTGTLQVAILTPAGKHAVVGYPLSFQANIGGRPLTCVWRFGDGVLTTNGFLVSHAYESSGEYSVVLEAANLSGKVSATVTVQIVSIAGATRYVTTNGNDAADGMSWATAKATIQAGVAAVTIPGALVLVSNGVYATGGAFAAGVTNRIAITNAVTVRSVNGPDVTIIQGQGPRGFAAVRCAYVADGAKLIGFTLTKGFTQASYSGGSGSGGGIYCDSAAGIMSNCMLTGNSAIYGGGAYNGTLYDCVITDNSASGERSSGSGGGSCGSTLYNCTLTRNRANYAGGGSYDGTLYNCTLIGNRVNYAGGGGSYGGTLHNCTLTGNEANYTGGGSSGGMLYNCTLFGNSARSGGGAFYSTLYNCIVYYNTASTDSNYYGCTLIYSCTTPDPGGIGNITNDPRFVHAALGDYHLQSTSPCINRGTNQDWMVGATDLDGNPRLDARGRVDMGAYEYQGMSIWSNTTAPIVVDAGPDSAVELGVKFKSDVAGNIAGIRFYKAVANTGTHVGNLWTSNGTLLATATFSNETDSGWQQVLFATPVTIASSTVYVASYHVENGHYSEDDYYFQGKGMDNSPLHMLMNGVFGGNGVYRYGTNSLFPNQTYNAANYYVDVVFQPKPAPILKSIAVTPTNSNIVIGATQQFTATGTYSDRSTQNLTSQATWTSSNPGVATINTSGLATGVSTGATTISATLAGVIGTTTLTVQAAPLVITTTLLPDGISNTVYTATLTADGGTTPYTWSIISGTLPVGLTLNSGSGVISGTPTVAGTSSFTVQVSDVGSHIASKTLSISMIATPTVITIWPSTAVPGVVDEGPDNAVELGVKFKSDVAGTITGIRFYKAEANTGAHTGNLWSITGTRLATVTFSNETVSGWQQALFATPVAITSNTVYVASYHVNKGHYSADINSFEGKGVDNPPLHALANGVSGGNGVYRYGANSLFPNQSWNAANYWVDVVFQPIQSAPLVITTTSLPNGAMNMAYRQR